MTERETNRLVAWSHELRDVHTRLRGAMRVTRETLAIQGASEPGSARAAAAHDLLLFCHGFCTALNAHHQGEDRTLFPAIAAAHPRLAPVLRSLQQDHSMITHLLGGLQAAVDHRASPAELERHLDGIEAVMESHFRYEERQLLGVLTDLELAADPADVLGPL